MTNDIGTVIMLGKMTNSVSRAMYAAMKGNTPFTAVDIGTLATPHTTFSTVPTGGVIKPIEQLITNSRPKYVGSIPAILMTGIKRGTRIRIVGLKSITMPTQSTSNIITAINRRGLSTSGPNISASC